MLVKLCIALLTCTICSISFISAQFNKTSRLARTVNPITIYQDVCTTIVGQTGNCMDQTSCTDAGGQASGTCFSGLKICCYMSYKCSSTSAQNNTHFIGPDTPTATGACVHTIRRVNENICQVRLDFEKFKLAGPDSLASCVSDYLSVSGGSPVPKICGENTGQHIYVDFPRSSSELLVIVSTTGSTVLRQWDIKVNQILCFDRLLAPPGCLQYFTSGLGTLKSFNYVANREGRFTTNLAYSICIRPAAGFCSVCYQQCDSNPSTGSFFLSGTAFASLNEIDCVTDFLMIPCGSSDTNSALPCTTNRFCGGTLAPFMGATVSAQVCSRVRPFQVSVFADDAQPNPEFNSGFCLTYFQNAC